MKIRCGLVSNSSSSSFTIATKEYLSEDKLRDRILQAMRVAPNSPIAWLADEIADILSEAEYTTLEDMPEHEGYADVEQLLATEFDDTEGDDDDSDDYDDECEQEESWFTAAVRKGFKEFYCGWASDETGDAVEYMLCHVGLSYEDDTLIIEKEPGY